MNCSAVKSKSLCFQKILTMYVCNIWKICVDVISEVLDVIGSHISSVSSVLARFNIHGGCYRYVGCKP